MSLYFDKGSETVERCHFVKTSVVPVVHLPGEPLGPTEPRIVVKF